MPTGLETLLESAHDVRDAREQDALWDEAKRLLGDAPFEHHWETYQAVFAGRRTEDGPPKAWLPDADTVAGAHVTALAKELGLPDLEALHRWSATDRAAFWHRVLQEYGMAAADDRVPALDTTRGVEEPDWFPGRTWNAVEACFRHDPGATALLAGGEGRPTERISYGQLQRLADQVSHGLRRLGLRPGDAVALYMPMNVECVALYLGVVQAGLCVVSIPDALPPNEVATRLRLGSARLLATVDHFLRGGKQVPMLAKAQEAAGDLPLLVVPRGEASGLRDQDTLWPDLLGEDEPATPVRVAPDTPSNILFSSGTTGEPKAIVWTHLTPFKCAMDGRYHQDIHAGEVVAWPTNIGWMMGPWLIYASLMNGAAIALYEGLPTSKGFVDFLRDERVAMLGVVPAIVRAWRASGAAAPGDLPDVRVFSSTGEASNPKDYLYLMSLAGHRAPVIEYCGGTEVGGGHLTGTVVQPASPATFTTPALGLDLVVLDEEGREVPPGGHGELFLVPPSVGLSQRLLNRDHHEEYYAGCPPGPHGEVLRRHGDQVQVLHGGFWAAQGRADDTMNLGGIKVGSVELERVMDGHPEVQETAAIAVPPSGGGADRLVVYAVAPGADPQGLREGLQQRIKERLNPLFRIHDLVLVDALPRTPSNKVMRRSLRGRYQE